LHAREHHRRTGPRNERPLRASQRRRRAEKKTVCLPETAGNRAQPSSCTLEAYGQAKGLPVDFLKRPGLDGITYSRSLAVRIPYFDQAGEETAVRLRLALEKHPERDDRFRWRKSSKPTL
jgi:hypothetical protein